MHLQPFEMNYAFFDNFTQQPMSTNAFHPIRLFCVMCIHSHRLCGYFFVVKKYANNLWIGAQSTPNVELAGHVLLYFLSSPNHSQISNSIDLPICFVSNILNLHLNLLMRSIQKPCLCKIVSLSSYFSITRASIWNK